LHRIGIINFESIGDGFLTPHYSDNKGVFRLVKLSIHSENLRHITLVFLSLLTNSTAKTATKTN